MVTYKKAAPPKRPRRGLKVASLSLVVILLGYIGWAGFVMPLPEVSAISPAIAPYFDTGKAELSWPNYGQSAVGTQEGGLLASSGIAESAPIASIAKVMTALSILKKHPLALGESGPTITITQADVAIYNEYFAKDGSLAAVKVGEKVTQLQALQAMLLPSANNFADTMAIWAFGSIEDYTAFANKYAQELGMTSSHFDDASGFSPKTVSTATDLIKLGQAAMDNPVIAGIVGQSTAVIPVAGTIHNTNGMLRINEGVIGIKTGNTDQAGGCMLVAMKYTFGSHDFVIISAVMGAPHLVPAMLAAKALANSAKANFINVKLVSKGQSFGTYATVWGKSSQAVANQDMSSIVWKGNNVQLVPAVRSIEAPAAQGETVGKITATGILLESSKTSPIVLSGSIDSPSLWWRLTHPLASYR